MPLNAGVLVDWHVTFDGPSFDCSSDGFDNKAENELVKDRSRAGESFKLSCKSRNALNDGKWIEKVFFFTQYCKLLEVFLLSFIVFLALEKPIAEFSHDGLVAKVTAESSPAAAKLTFAIYQCPANEIELKKKGTKENREMVENLKQKCVKAKIYGDKHFIDRKLARSF